MTDIVIVGAGGFAREVYQWICDTYPSNEFCVKGFLSNNPHDLDRFSLEHRILDDPEVYNVNSDDKFVLAVGDIDTRVRLVNSLKAKGASFMTVIHKSAYVASSARIGEGVVVCPFALISADCFVDDFSMLNTYSSCGHDSSIGKHCILSPYAVVNGNVNLGEKVFMATHSTVIPRIAVGSNSKISANSVAMRNVPANSLVYGVPGKVFHAY